MTVFGHALTQLRPHRKYQFAGIKTEHLDISENFSFNFSSVAIGKTYRLRPFKPLTRLAIFCELSAFRQSNSNEVG
jgi:hypothetical protein